MSRIHKKCTNAVIQMKASDISELRAKILKEDQKGLCLVCRKVPERPCLDHSHKKRVKGTGLIRGVLCSSCNIFIAKSENNCMRFGFSQIELPSIMRSMADYLERDHYPYTHPSEAPPPKKLTKRSYNKLKTIWNNDPDQKHKVFPPFPKSGKMIKALQSLYDYYNLEAEYYKD